VVLARGRFNRAYASDHGYAMAALLVTLAVMGVMLTVLLPAWSTQAKREKEAELVFRGEQYARAIGLFGRRFPNALPPSVDILVEQKFLRKKYKDPVTGEDFVYVGPGSALPGSVGQPVPPRGAGPGTAPAPGGRAGAAPAPGGRTGATPGSGPGRGTVATGVAGVASKSTDTSLRLYNGRNKYNEWVFMPVQGSRAAGVGARGAGQPGIGPRGGLPAGAIGPGGRGAGGRGASLPPGGRGRSGP
jgi:type II secretory pathway pseudopilin PulG